MNPATTETGKLTELPGQTVPYVLAAGGGRAHLLIDQVGRCLGGAEETAGAMSMMTLDGPAGRAIPLHFHRQEYEFFFCHRGNVQLWLGDESRLLSPGDFGFAPPNTVHAYALPGNHSGFIGPIIPGGWDRFFGLTGIPYSGNAPFPVGFQPEIPFAKFGQAEHDFDMKYLPEAEYAAPRSDAPDDALPSSAQPYFLRRGEGPRHLVGGMLVTTLIGAAETDGGLSMFTVELPRGAGVPAHAHEQTTEGLYVLEGGVRLTLDASEYSLRQGDYASIPPGAAHSWQGEAFFTKVLSMSTPGGLEGALAGLGEPTELHMFAEGAALSGEALAAGAAGADVQAA